MVGVYEGALFFGGCLFIEQFYVCMFWGLFVGICVYYVFVCWGVEKLFVFLYGLLLFGGF